MILKLHQQGLTVSAIAEQTGMIAKQSASILRDGWRYLPMGPGRRARRGLTLTNIYLRERMLAYPNLTGRRLLRELRKKHVTLRILWEEYIARHPDGYKYSRWCELYKNWEGRISVTMRQSHAGGDKLFVDYAGDTVPVIIDRLTGEVKEANIFVAVLGASSFTYAEASWTQGLADWIGSHTRAFEAIGGVPNLLVPDNTKTAIIKACLYEPQVNRTYAEMATHYNTAILPARPLGALQRQNSSSRGHHQGRQHTCQAGLDRRGLDLSHAGPHQPQTA